PVRPFGAWPGLFRPPQADRLPSSRHTISVEHEERDGCAILSGPRARTAPVATTLPLAATFPVEETTIGQLHAAYLAGKTTAHEVTRAYIDRIAAYDKRGLPMRTSSSRIIGARRRACRRSQTASPRHSSARGNSSR